MGFPRIVRFQFHFGLIKSLRLAGKHVVALLFQFHFGLIKRLAVIAMYPVRSQFQFHFGLIKSILNSILSTASSSFNSILV